MTDRVLILDDDDRLASMLRTYLAGRGVDADHAPDVASGLKALAGHDYAALILDVMLPDGDGFDVCRAVRADSDIPILMLTARGDELDRIVGLEIGADDYLPKPFNPRELLARLKAILRRRRPAAPAPVPTDTLTFGRLEIDRSARVVRVGGEERRLTSHQFGLLVVLAERAGRVLSREQIMDAVRGEELEAYDRSIDVHISRIRAAIEEDPKHPRRIRTVRGAGYVFTAAQDG